MTAGEVLLVAGAVLGALAFAALGGDAAAGAGHAAAPCAREVAAMRAETAPLLADLRTSTDEARAAVEAAQADLDRFDKVLGSAEAISVTAARAGGVARTTLSAPMIKAAGLATGTSRAVRAVAAGRVMRRLVWFAGGVAAGAVGAGYAKRKVAATARKLAPANVARGAVGSASSARRGASPTPSAKAARRPRSASGSCAPSATGAWCASAITCIRATRCSSTASRSSPAGSS